MSVVGIVAEYNPLHEGHAYHIKKSLEETGADTAVCVLSSEFVQRGEPALIGKRARARMALMNGIDLVIELPAVFSCGSAEYFASAAVKLLDSLGTVDFISFGSEAGNLEKLMKAADLLAYETPDFKKALKDSLSRGLSFPQARQEALRNCLDDDAFKSVSSPNNILGIEYLKALKRLNSGIKPVTVGRMGRGYRDESLDKTFSSATAIRNHIRSAIAKPLSDKSMLHADTGFDIPTGLVDTLYPNMPESCVRILETEFKTGRGPVFPENFGAILFHRLRTANDRELMALPYMEEGLQNRLRQASLSEDSLDGLVSFVTTSRYPSSRINRILCALLLGITGSFLDELKDNGYVRYIRILGFSEKGKKLLAASRKKSALPILMKPAYYRKLEDPLARKLFEQEIRTTDVYGLAYRRPELRKGGSELITPPVIVGPLSPRKPS